MDFLGYAALGGLERIVIIVGAVLIGFWGYRLYGKDKKPGLIFMGIASAILLGALFTTSNHVQSVSEGIQLANVTRDLDPIPAPVATETPPAEEEAIAEATASEGGEATPWADQRSPTPDGEITQNTTSDTVADTNSIAAVVPSADATLDAGDPSVDAGDPSVIDDTSLERSPRLATGQELGGRIVSVKSANISLEWSNSN